MTKKTSKNLSYNLLNPLYFFIVLVFLTLLISQPILIKASAATNTNVAKLRIFSYDGSSSISSNSLQTQSLYTAEEMQRQDELFFYYCENDYKEDFPIYDISPSDENVSLRNDSSSSSSLGHAFIVVTNLTTTNLTVGHMTVAPGENVSIGTYPDDSSFGSNSSYDRGIWYNREMYGNNGGTYGTYGNATSIDTYLTQAELNSLNSFVKDSSNDAWDLFNNCSRFAARAWNVVGEFELSAGWPCTPAYLVNNIRTHNGYNTYDPLGSYNGRRAYVKNGALIYE